MLNNKIRNIKILLIMVIVSCYTISGCAKNGQSSSNTSSSGQSTSSKAQTESEISVESKEEISSVMSSIEKESEDANVLTKGDIVFVGDSRTLSMSSGGKWSYELVDSSLIFATWGGELTEDTAVNNAETAAKAMKKCGVFWYGINDIQEDWNKENPLKIVSDYKKIIDIYHQINSDSKIVILSILNTSKDEKDYYQGQEENINTVNEGLKGLADQYGGRYIDISSLLTGDDDFAKDDQIHFSKEWYVNKFLPTVYDTIINSL